MRVYAWHGNRHADKLRHTSCKEENQLNKELLLKLLVPLALISVLAVACAGQNHSDQASTPQSCASDFVADNNVRFSQEGQRFVAYDRNGSRHEMSDRELNDGQFLACGQTDQPVRFSRQASNWQQPPPRQQYPTHDQRPRR